MITGHEKKGENENMNDENMKEPVPVQDADVGTAADVEAVMKNTTGNPMSVYGKEYRY